MSSTAGARLRRAGRAVAGLSGRASSSVLSLSIAARPRLRVAGVGEVELAGASVAGVAREYERGAVRRQQWSDLRAGGVDRGIQPHPGCPAVSAAFDPRSEEHTSGTPVTNAHLVCRLLLEKNNTYYSYRLKI